jgi:hypothetical protein
MSIKVGSRIPNSFLIVSQYCSVFFCTVIAFNAGTMASAQRGNWLYRRGAVSLCRTPTSSRTPSQRTPAKSNFFFHLVFRGRNLYLLLPIPISLFTCELLVNYDDICKSLQKCDHFYTGIISLVHLNLAIMFINCKRNSPISLVSYKHSLCGLDQIK